MSTARAASPPSVRRAQPAVAGAGSTRWLDLARAAATVAVLALHVVAPVISADDRAGTAVWWIANGVDSGLRWCVPVFVMVSGALLLRVPPPTATASFLRRRFRRVGVPLLVWVVFYLGFRELYDRGGADPGAAVRELAAGSPFLHLHYLFIILGLYVLTPWLRVLVAAAPTRTVAGLAAVMLGLGFADGVLTALAGQGEPNAATRALPFVGYYLLGHLLRDVVPPRRRVRQAAAAAAAAWAVTALGTGWWVAGSGWDERSGYLYGFLSPTVAVQSVAVFVLLQAAGRGRWWTGASRAARSAATVSSLSFGVYLVHPAVLLPLRRATGLPETPGAFVLTATALLVATLAGSLAFAAVAERTPLLRAAVGVTGRRQRQPASTGA